ncbi:hypothetical protein, partial [Mycolicibacterium setense]|uniref:hypothetical protein n=1 Tax=Mycolicibacterium setense TaxID=431269 RepID=UPI001A97C38D
VTKGLQEAGQFSVAAHWSVFSCRRQECRSGSIPAFAEPLLVMTRGDAEPSNASLRTVNAEVCRQAHQFVVARPEHLFKARSTRTAEVPTPDAQCTSASWSVQMESFCTCGLTEQGPQLASA